MPGTRRLCAGCDRRAGRRVRRHVQLVVLPQARAGASRRDRTRRRVPGDAGQRKGLHRHARRAQAQPDRPGDQRAHRLLHVAGGGGAGFRQLAQRSMPHGAGRRRGRHLPAQQRLPVPGRRDAFARRPHALVRRRCAGHRVQRWRRGGAAQAALRCHRRWRHHLCRHPRRGGQQRRRAQGQLHRAQCHRPGAGDCRRAGMRWRRATQHHVRRSSRHGDAAR